MQQILKFGVPLVTADGHDVGSLHHVVIDAATRTVTAITGERPLLESGNVLKPGGWSMPRDQRVPISAVTGTDERDARIGLTKEEFLAMPPYVIGEIPEPDGEWTPPPEFVAEDVTTRASALLGGALYEPPRDEIENRGPTERHLSGGSAVWRHEPHTHLGDVDRVIMDDVTNAVTGLVVRSGVVFHHDVIMPMERVVELLDDLVHVEISEDTWHTLAAYKPGN